MMITIHSSVVPVTVTDCQHPPTSILSGCFVYLPSQPPDNETQTHWLYTEHTNTFRPAWIRKKEESMEVIDDSVLSSVSGGSVSAVLARSDQAVFPSLCAPFVSELMYN